jgi:long-chain acyl-CoA synthetase
MDEPSMQVSGSGNPIELIFQQASKLPSNPALVSPRLTLSYKQLVRLSKQTAQRLARLGIERGQVVGVQCQPETTVVVWLALLQLGAVSLHVTTETVKSRGGDLDFVVVDDNFSRLAHKNLITLTADFFESLEATSPLEDIAELDSKSLVRVVFSSGTTGIPKGVPFDVETFLGRVESATKNWIPRQPFMSLLGPETVSGFQTVFAQLFEGQTCFVSHNSSMNWKLIQSHGIKSIKTSPAKLADLIRSLKSDINDAKVRLPLEEIQVAGGLLPISLAANCEETFALTPIYLYGSTEVGTANCVGTMVSEVDCEIVDLNETPVTTGEIGSVRIRRRPMPNGYWKEERYSPNGFRDGWFYPGDRGWVNSSRELFIEGRSDDQVNAGGVKVNLAQLDQQIGDLDQLSDAATFEFTGSLGESLLGLAYTSIEPIDPQEVERIVGNSMPALRFNAFVKLDSIPRNNLGKAQRDKLAESVKGK